MKKIALLTILIGILAVSGLRADDNEMQTLFGNNAKFSSSLYGAVEVRGTSIYSNSALEVGGRGVWVINNTFGIGIQGMGITSNHNIPVYRTPYDSLQTYLRTGYGGLFLEYINNANSLVHFNVHALIGAGGAVYVDRYNDSHNNDYYDNHRNYESSAYFVFEPGAGVEFNITTFFKLGINGGYRMVSGLDLPNTTNKDLSGPFGGLTFKFGNFKIK
jgi:hypothetical protein